MRRIDPGMLAMLLVLSNAPHRAFAQDYASAVAGVVRDIRGVPQLGALVQLLGVDSLVVAATYTDDHGRYTIFTAKPGRYQLRTSATFLLPAVKHNLRLVAGSRTLADVTLNSLFDVGTWLPVQRRSTAEPADDWRWTMRSSAERPLLRLAHTEDENGSSSSAGAQASAGMEETPGNAIRAEWTTLIGSSGVLDSGVRQTLQIEQRRADGRITTVQATLGASPAGGVGGEMAPAFAARAGFETDDPVLQREFRAVASVRTDSSVDGAGGHGFEALSLATGEKIELGDVVTIDAGTLLSAERLLASRISSAPFLRVAVHPVSDLTLMYRYAGSKTLQSLSDTDKNRLEYSPLSDTQGRPLGNTVSHQEFAIARTSGRDVATLAVYRDAFVAGAVEGGGATHAERVAGLPITLNTANGAFLLTLPGYTARGMMGSYKRVLTPALRVSLQADYGTTLALKEGTGAVPLTAVAKDVMSCTRLGVTGELTGTVSRSQTEFQVRYHWQPKTTLNLVNAFDLPEEQAYASVLLKQHLWSGWQLRNVSAILEATNLLAEGYQPGVGSDGKTLFLAQVPRALQAGLTLSF